MVLELTPTPLANSFPETPYTGEKIPLQVMECPECHHVQLKHVADAEVLFSDYKYSTPEAFRPHLEECARKLKVKYPDADKVLEIGSNNGMFVDILRGHFRAVIGVDPASPDPRYQRLFTPTLAQELKDEGWEFDLIVANNVFAHIDNLHEVFDGIEQILSEQGAVVFEVQYLPAMLAAGTFDMIYHEHHDYHTLRPFNTFLRLHKMEVTDFEMIPTHGGSVRVTARRWGTGYRLSSPQYPQEFLDWPNFAAKIEAAKQRTLRELAKVGGKIVAFGATAKACTLIHHFGIADRIAYCYDETPQKKGRYIPGTDIEITDRMGNPEALLLTAWNYEDVARKRWPHLHIINPFQRNVERKAA